MVVFLDLVEPAAQPQRDHLRLQVGVLAAGDLIAVDIRAVALDAALEGIIALADVLPVVGEVLETIQIQTGVPLGSLQCRHNGVEGGLAGHAGHGGDGAVHHVHTGLGSQQAGGHLVAGGVVGVELDGDADLLLQRGDQLLGGVGLQNTGHILDGQHMSAAMLQLLGHLHIVVQRVFVSLGIQNVAGVADGSLTDLALIEHLVHGDFHAGDPVQGVEHPEHIDAGTCGFLDEFPDNVIGIVGIAHGVGAPQQHLQQKIGRFFPD